MLPRMALQNAGSRAPTPLRWVPTSYLAMGLVYVTVGSVANIMLKNLGPILAMGVLVRVSGTLHERLGGWRAPWTIILLVIAALVLVMGLYHARALPAGGRAADAPASAAEAARIFGRAFATFFAKPQ